ncbi:MAG TPA: YwqJ-related putative deaminase [Mycobacteriales bacterium]|nr:YwqJ-related putative deaminase [Mycobacteriales bacterium]
MSSITRDEADRIAQKWVADSAPPGATFTAAVHEFDLGYVVWAKPPAGQAQVIGGGRGIIDRETGDLSVWPSLPVATVIEQFRACRAERPPAPRTWDPAEQARRDLRRVATPATVTHLTYQGELLSARSGKGDAEPQHHPLVAQFYRTELDPQYRERGCERCSDPAAISDALHREDARRTAAGEPPITREQARDEMFAGADLVSYRVREPGDPAGGQAGPPCIPCALLGQYFGFIVVPPAGELEELGNG